MVKAMKETKTQTFRKICCSIAKKRSEIIEKKTILRKTHMFPFSSAGKVNAKSKQTQRSEWYQNKNPTNFRISPINFTFYRETNIREGTHLGRSHGGLQSREAVIEGTQNRNHAVRYCLALLKWFPHHGSSLAQWIRGRCR